MNTKELIERIKNLPFSYIHNEPYLNKEVVLEFAKHLDEPETGHADEAPRYVKNILARLRELPVHDREVWLKAIMGEFEQDFSRAKWREGYEQGKVEGMVERDKVTIPQFVADWIKYCKNTNVTMTRALLVGEVDFYNYANQKDLSRLTDFFSDGKNQEIFARSWLDGYTVEKEKRYRVEMKGISSLFRHLKYNFLTEKWYMGNDAKDKNVKKTHTRKELEGAGFGEVFNSPLFEVVEVEE